jgi:hypothetical protein
MVFNNLRGTIFGFIVEGLNRLFSNRNMEPQCCSRKQKEEHVLEANLNIVNDSKHRII